MNVLGIETSCDETAASVVKDGKTVLSNIIFSQAELHNKTGGVVPEVASREHVKDVIPVIDKAVLEAGLSWEGIDLIAVTSGPGLIGALLVGLETAKAISYAKDIDIVGVNHITGHIYSTWLENMENVKFPIVTLTVSGGHNHLVLFRGHYDFEILGKTRDDASGEAFDKTAKIIGLPYPGGPHISRKALDGDKNRFKFPRVYLDKEGYEFSFSGLKTAVWRQVNDLKTLSEKDVCDISASFQEAVVEVLADKLIWAADRYEAKEVHVVGGVSANNRLRELVQEKTSKKIRFPKHISFCTDNAAMIAASGYWRFKTKGADTWKDLKADPRMKL